MTKTIHAILCGLMLAFAAAAYGQTGTDLHLSRCAALAKLQIPGVALQEITKAEWHAAGKTPAQPARWAWSPGIAGYCRIADTPTAVWRQGRNVRSASQSPSQTSGMADFFSRAAAV